MNEFCFDDLLLSHIKKLVKKVKGETRELILKQGISLSHEEIFIYILIVYKKINTCTSINNIVENSHKSNVSRILKNLLDKDLIKQETDLNDKRIKHFVSSNESFELELKNIIVNVNNKYQNKVSVEEYKTFLKILKKMVD